MDATFEQLEPRQKYIHFVEQDDIPSLEPGDTLDEWVNYPKKSLRNVGEVRVRLFGIKDETELQEGVSDEPALVITDSGSKQMSTHEAMRAGYYELCLQVESPIRRRGLQAVVYATYDGINDQYRGELYNESESEEEMAQEFGRKADSSVTAGTLLECFRMDAVDKANPSTLMVQNSPKALSKIGMRFEILQGGDTQQ